MRRQSENIDKAEEGLRELTDYDDWDEPTARTDVHVHMHSEHDGGDDLITPKKPLTKALQVGIAAAVTALLAWLANRFGAKP